ncbi:MAG: alpha-galactosidase, partial [Ruminococcus sp.]|nr:alpha-galactosidase [Ruminococcus sp.]
KDIKTAVPFWPMGLSRFDDDYVSLGLRNADGSAYIALWRREGDSDSVSLPVGFLEGERVSAECIYPSFNENGFAFENGALKVDMPQSYTARLFKLTPVKE